jgi:two-component system phosphate regulon sensor histidine kinase PhoR
VRLQPGLTRLLALEIGITAVAGGALLALLGWPAGVRAAVSAAVGAAAIGGGFAYLLSARAAAELRRSLREIAAAAAAGADGRLRPVHEESFVEVRETIAAFNAMVAQSGRTIADLDRGKRTLEAVLAHMSDGLLILDTAGALVLVNPAAERIFGVSAEFAVGRHLIEAVHHFELDALVRQADRERIPLVRELEVHQPQRRALRVQANPVWGGHGKFAGTVVAVQDVTDLRRTDLIRQEFIANVSHELRTPLASLRALAETLLDGALRDRDVGPRFLGRIVSEIDRLTLLVNDLLDLSAIESGSAKMQMAPVALGAVARDVTSRFRPVAEQREVELRVEVLDDLPDVWGDEARLVQAFVNLMDNALKYTPAGGTVTLSARVDGDLVAVTVADSGLGIAAQHLPRIFERFYRVDPSRSRVQGGTGLGLSIVKHIATSHGGRVEVQSVEGRGSEFTLLIPRTPVRSAAG